MTEKVEDNYEEEMPDKSQIYMVTNSGVKFFPFDVEPEMINIEDISHALSRICRFNGHPDDHYSVSQHSVLMARDMCEQYDEPSSELRLKTLLHDSAEAYISDVPAPIKTAISDELPNLEDSILESIFERFGLSTDPFLPKEIKEMDVQILKQEKTDVLKDNAHSWGLEDVEVPAEADLAGIEGWTYEESREEFLRLFEKFFPL